MIAKMAEKAKISQYYIKTKKKNLNLLKIKKIEN